MPTPVARSMAGSALTESRRRPHDRKQRILSAAAALFWSRGYHQVGMADIAASVGITAGALYRHVDGKRELLAAVLSEALGDLVAGPEPHGLDDMVDRLVVRGLERREFTALWEREKRELATVDREEIGRRIRAIQALIMTELKGSRPHESPGQLDLRASAVLAVAESPSYQELELGARRPRDVLRSAASAVAVTDVPAADEVLVALSGGPDPQAPVSRREALLHAAVDLFAERGYPHVSLADIGAVTGIAGPSIYQYFETKDDVLNAGLNRGTEALWLTLHDALADADGACDALERALRSYVLLAATKPNLLSVILIEAVHLPAAPRARYDRARQDFVAEWVALLRRARPELRHLDAHVLVGACLSLPNTLLRSAKLRHRPNLAGEVECFARHVLAAPVNVEARWS